MNQLIHKGSTKDIYNYSESEYLFHFTDRYSIFDYGEMPDPIPGKGKATALLTNYLYPIFEELTKIKTHLIGVTPNGDELIVLKVDVPREKDISWYQTRPQNAFVPLEVIFRLGVPQGSSLLSKGYKLGDKFKTPMVEFTTKLEAIDRKLSDHEAMKIAGMNEDELLLLKDQVALISLTLASELESVGLTLWDGKFEFAFTEGRHIDLRNFMLVDSIGLDELRVTLDDFPLSKESLRSYYKNFPWYQELSQAKEVHGNAFKAHVTTPPKLPTKVLQMIAEIYILATDLIVNKSDNLKTLKSIIKELKSEYPHSR